MFWNYDYHVYNSSFMKSQYQLDSRIEIKMKEAPKYTYLVDQFETGEKKNDYHRSYFQEYQKYRAKDQIVEQEIQEFQFPSFQALPRDQDTMESLKNKNQELRKELAEESLPSLSIVYPSARPLSEIFLANTYSQGLCSFDWLMKLDVYLDISASFAKDPLMMEDACSWICKYLQRRQIPQKKTPKPKAPMAYLNYFFQVTLIIIIIIFISLYRCMCSQLIQIYQKRTPTFLAQAFVIIASLLLLLQPQSTQCGLQKTLYTFYLIVASLGGTELLLKLVLFSYIYFRNRQIADTYSTVVLFLVAAAHLALWIYSISLYSNSQLMVCHIRDSFFVKSYVWVYGVMIVGGIVFFIVLLLSVAGVILFALKKNKKEGQEDLQL